MEGIWPGHRGYTPTLYKKCHGIFNDHRESGPRFNVSELIDDVNLPGSDCHQKRFDSILISSSLHVITNKVVV